jgi:hypothetical protein
MKALLAAVALLALNAAAAASADAGGPRQELRQSDIRLDAATPTLVADAGRVGAASLSAWNGLPWADSAPEGAGLPTPSGANLALITLGALVLILPRPLARTLRRREQQRRAVALASALEHTPRS